MKCKTKYLIILYILLVFLSCSDKDLLNKSEKDYLLSLTESENLVLSEINGSLVINLYNSKVISEQEQKLFSSIILKEVNSILDKKRKLKDTNAENTIAFINGNKKNHYTIKNTTIAEAVKCYETIDKLVTVAEKRDKESAEKFTRNILSEDKRMSL